MSTIQPNIANIQRAVNQALHQHWVFYLVEGIVLLVIGATAAWASQVLERSEDMLAELATTRGGKQPPPRRMR